MSQTVMYQQQLDPRQQAIHPPLEVFAQQLKQHCGRRAMLAAAVSMVPIPFLDIAVDAVILSQQLDHVHQQCGLSLEQIQALSPQRKQQTYTAIQTVGNHIIGRYITQRLVLSLLMRFGVRLTATQLSKWVPIVGQVVSATVNYVTMRYVLNKHIDDCMLVLRKRDQIKSA